MVFAEASEPPLDGVTEKGEHAHAHVELPKV